MSRSMLRLGLAGIVALRLMAGPAAAQQSGGTLRFFHRDSPGSMSIHEEATISTVGPTMAVFNNLVLFNQHEKQNRLEFIEPELAESWSWNEDGKALTFKLRHGVKWHDGKPFTAADAKCTCDIPTGKFDMTFPYEATVQSIRDIEAQAPDAICELTPTIVAINLLLTRDAPPFDNPDIRRAMQLTLDRKSFIDILSEGQGDISGAMLPPPAGLWGLPPEILATLPGYGPDVEKSRAEARKLMEKHGYGPDKRLAVKVATRNIPQFRDPAVIMIDQMKQIYIDGVLDVVETANWYPKVARRDYMVGTNLSGSGVDDPDAYFYEHYACGSERNYTNYCNPDLDKMYEQQSLETDQQKRKKLVWEIDRRLQEDAARPMIYHYRLGTCHYKRVHGITVMLNSIFNSWRLEDAWLDR